MSKHTDFILTPITIILEEAVSGSSGIGDSIETHPVFDYIFQSIFLKMTGFQEQKMRCIAWELGTNDFEFRYWWLEEANLGTYSNYREKNSIYKEFCQSLKKVNKDFSLDSIDRSNLLKNTNKKIKDIFAESNLISWIHKDFSYFLLNDWTDEKQFLQNEKRLFEEIPSKSSIPKEPKRSKDDSDQSYQDKIRVYKEKDKRYKENITHNLKNKYENLYEQRNRLAHNTLSYQQNLPTFSKLLTEDPDARNYFIWFGILTLIDNIFIELYRYYQEGLEEEIEY